MVIPRCHGLLTSNGLGIYRGCWRGVGFTTDFWNSQRKEKALVEEAERGPERAAALTEGSPGWRRQECLEVVRYHRLLVHETHREGNCL